MGKVLSFGELLLRICPDGEGAWLKKNRLPFYVGGAELNVATALARWEIPVAYFTALPQNFLGDSMTDYLQNQGIDTSSIFRGGNRIGLYFLPKGKDLKNAGVIYDRSHSSFAELQAEDLDWEVIFNGVSWFHFSAICPALTPDAAKVCLRAVQEAKRRSIPISLDLNYRAKLWKYGKEPGEVMPELAAYADLIMGNIWAAEKMLGSPFAASINEHTDKESLLQQAKITSEELLDTYENCTKVALTFRFDEGAGIRYYTTLKIKNQWVVSPEYRSAEISDKVGSGDCFMAGLIYGFYKKLPAAELLHFATAAAYRKLFITSDATTDGIKEIEETMRIKHLSDEDHFSQSD